MPITVQRYTPIPDAIVVPVETWKQAVDDYLPNHGVRFVVSANKDSSKIEKRQQERAMDENSQVKRRKRIIRYVFKTYHVCHRAGNKQRRQDRPKGGNSGVSREKKSKKINCPARLIATCWKNSPQEVILEHVGVHNHQVGGPEDLQHLPLSKATKDLIEQRLREGFKRRDTRISIQNFFNQCLQTTPTTTTNTTTPTTTTNDETNTNNVIIHRDQMVHATEIYNVFKKIEPSLSLNKTTETL